MSNDYPAGGDHQRADYCLDNNLIKLMVTHKTTLSEKAPSHMHLLGKMPCSIEVQKNVSTEKISDINQQSALIKKQNKVQNETEIGIANLNISPNTIKTEDGDEQDSSEVPTLVMSFHDFLRQADCIIEPSFITSANKLYFPHKTSWNQIERFYTPDYRCDSALAHDLFPEGYVYHPNAKLVYKIINVLGMGSFGRVYTTFEKVTKRYFACKVIIDQYITRHNLAKVVDLEIKIHRKLNHPNIISFANNFTFCNNIYIFTELAYDKTLLELLRARSTLTLTEVKFFIKGIVEGLAYLERSCVIHRDIKLANMLLSLGNFQIKIADFGMALFSATKQEIHTEVCGTANFMPPEMITFTGYGFKADVWAAGCIFYCLVFGEPPFGKGSNKEVHKRIREARYVIPPIDDQDASEMIHCMMKYHKVMRPTASQLLSMRFINSGDIASCLSEDIFQSATERDFY